MKHNIPSMMLFLSIFIMMIASVTAIQSGTLIINNTLIGGIGYFNNSIYMIGALPNSLYYNSTSNASIAEKYDLSSHTIYDVSSGLYYANNAYCNSPRICNAPVLYRANTLMPYFFFTDNNTLGVIYGFTSNTFPKIEKCYMNGAWTCISSPYSGFTGATADTADYVRGFNSIMHKYFQASGGFSLNSNWYANLYNQNTTATSTINITGWNSPGTNNYYTYDSWQGGADYSILYGYAIYPNGTITYLNPKCVGLGFYNTTSNKSIYACGSTLYASTSLANISSQSVNVSHYITCGTLSTLNQITALDCVNDNDCMIGGTYPYNNINYTALVHLINQNTCEDVYTMQPSNDIANSTIISITHDPIGNYYYNIVPQLQYIGGGNYGYMASSPSGLFEYATSNATIANNTPLCIDNNYLCANPIISNGGVACNIGDETYCSAGCTNTNTSGTLIGSCNPSTCTNTCNIKGLNDCTGSTTFATCGIWGTSQCLTYSTEYSCPIGQVCSNGACINNPYTNNVIVSNNTAFNFVPYSTNSDNTIYNLDTVNRKLTVNTNQLLQVQGFNIQTAYNNTYSSDTCDYKETIQYSNNVQSTLNATTILPVKTLSQNAMYSTTIYPASNATITLQDSLGNNLTGVYLVNNQNATSVCAYTLNGTLINCQFSLASVNDLTSITITFNIDYGSSTYTMTETDNRQQSLTYNTQPSAISLTNGVSQIGIYTSNATFYNASEVSYTTPKGFSATLTNNYNYLTCSYGTTGTYDVRMYNNNNGLPDFTNYKDYTIYIQGIGLSASQLASAGNPAAGMPALSDGMKLFVILLLLLFELLGFTAITYTTMHDAKPGFATGAIIAFFTIIAAMFPDFFLIGGFIPVWFGVALIILILLVGGYIIFIKNESGGSGA